uniref:Uncharacterized protein n=1 Tax=Proboscia inermis TaxID=420281 RepID=A0A7S0CM10_9STRA|mmetsp:Transcript_5452/g.5681  ORF Transcript_5452/g.5681 Transcript_5452/m.5681 type:complete len:171 (+) Transcript_5452:585-1097(+)
MSFLLGMCVPYLGYKEAAVGGRIALENILFSGFIVALCFVLSDFDYVQRFVVVGSEKCSQDVVNIVVGIWWTMSFLASIFCYKMIPPKKFEPQYHDGGEEEFLKESCNSPVGFVVPNIPDFYVDPLLNSRASISCSEKSNTVFGVCIALLIGSCITSLGFADTTSTLSSV